MPRWRVDIIRKCAERLGTIEAANEKEAIEKAAKEFDIPPERQNRITLEIAGHQRNATMDNNHVVSPAQSAIQSTAERRSGASHYSARWGIQPPRLSTWA